ncbi:hypothetical protein HPB50_014173 [Hyalomma asiaticum]|uniref:Uncharacterized protein n=1 Tax=Hyalomma asiaticum TaxID=266040 RepID=A0ACB7SHV6_HYAAI|nr:hypothetical protein HPB50_014173 [Hyalomma asiaticum]
MLEDLGVRTLPWPPCGADANPIENVWARMKWVLSRRNLSRATSDALWNAIQEEWEALRSDGDYVTSVAARPQATTQHAFIQSTNSTYTTEECEVSEALLQLGACSQDVQDVVDSARAMDKGVQVNTQGTTPKIFKFTDLLTTDAAVLAFTGLQSRSALTLIANEVGAIDNIATNTPVLERVVLVRVLVGVSPAVLLTFVSDNIGGRASGKARVEKSGVLNKLNSFGDDITVNKGFNLDDICGKAGIGIVQPPFLRHESQLSAEGAGKTLKIARARVVCM